ncbi:RNA polymerase sigma factor [Variovorax sp. Root411]|uniref:RNA polymerase sigma factor n=1 Tax=Variovorax sp. Root411 TaxID=1736530 RepID=UPI0006FACA7A|nr:RNA polymerase sigma factor [Variovorax sp. Root411]KQW54110.1 RNA polymerase subunit sigma [Variovorax sp. Root411]
MPHIASTPDAAPATEGASDRELAARSAQGDAQAFAAIMRRHNQLLFRTARSVLKSDSETEDAVQEAYLRAWRAIGTFRDDAQLSTWLVRIVINEALGRLRRRGAQVIPLDGANVDHVAPDPDPASAVADDPDLQPERLAMREEIRLLMERRIDRLPDAYRTVFMLRAVEEMSVAQTSIALSLPEATVRTRFFRARSLLREGLSRDMDVALGDAFSFDGARCDRIVAGVLSSLVDARESPRS